MNKVILLGEVMEDAKQRQAGQSAVVQFRVNAKTRYFHNSQWKERSTYMTCVYWGNAAVELCPSLLKGAVVTVEGELSNRSWEDKQGGKRYVTEVNAQSVQLVLQAEGSYGEPDQPPLGEDNLPF
jgi:single-strand DNA-binding protein